MTYALAQKMALAFLFVYALIGMWGHVSRDGAEDLYPFFSWSLFVEVPAREQHDFEVRIDSAGDMLLPQDVPGLIDESLSPQYIDQVLHEFGSALESGERERIDRARAAFESLLEKTATYEIYAVKYNPPEKFLFNANLSNVSLARFDFSPMP